MMTRIFSGIKPTGHLTLGNYLGALRRWVEVDQHQADALFSVVDLHALTVEHDPARVRRLSRQAASRGRAECAPVAADLSGADGGRTSWPTGRTRCLWVRTRPSMWS